MTEEPTAPGDETGEETEPTADLPEDGPGIEGQILYPDPEVDAERAAGFAAGKYDTLYPEDNDDNGTGHSRSGWQNPADRPSEEQKQDEEEYEEQQT